MIIIFGLISFLIGAAAWRLRGSFIIPSDTLARFGVWGGTVGGVVGMATHNLIYALAAIILAGIGASFGYWGNFDLTTVANRTWSNFWKLSAMGCIRFAPLFAAALGLDVYHHADILDMVSLHILPAVLAGFSFYPAYRIGVWLSTHAKPLIKIEGQYLLQVPSSWGEALFGGTILATLTIGLILCTQCL